MSDPATASQPSLIASLFTESSTLFRRFYLALARRDCRVNNQVSLSKVGDEYGRLGVWGGDSGAQRSGRGSLDDALRYESTLRSIVVDILEDLMNDLSRAALIAENSFPDDGIHSNENNSDEDSASSISSETDLGLVEAATAAVENPHPKRTDFQHLVASIFDHIRSLYKLSALLRRPSVPNKYIRSICKDQVVSHFGNWDQAHVENKFRDAAAHLVQRLGLANTRRRQQLRYWENHPERYGTDQPQPTLADHRSSQLPLEPRPSSLTGPWPHRMTMKPAAFMKPSQSLGVTSQTTKQSFSTVALSMLNDAEASCNHSRTVYESSIQGATRSLRVPDVPKASGVTSTFNCPFCFARLDVQTMQKRHLWKKHVFRDLRPYVCTFEKCVNAEKLYSTRHDWLYHELQVHRRRWLCTGSCGLSFTSKSLLEQHMTKQHADISKEFEFSILLDMCERPAASDEKDTCPLCLEEHTLLGLRSHLAAHLEELALFVLPVGTDDDNEDADSNIAERLEQKRELHDDDGLGTLSNPSEVEAVEASTQNAADFSKLTAAETQAVQVDCWVKESMEHAASEGHQQMTLQNTFEDGETVRKSSKPTEMPHMRPKQRTRNHFQEIFLNTIKKDYYNTYEDDCMQFVSNPPSEEAAKFKRHKMLTDGMKRSIVDARSSPVPESDTVLQAKIEKFEDEVLATIQKMDKTMQFDRMLEEISNTYYNQLAPQCEQFISRGKGATDTEYTNLKQRVLALIHKCDQIEVGKYAELEAKKQKLVNEAGDMLQMMDVVEMALPAHQLEQIAKRYRLLVAPKCVQFISDHPNEKGVFDSKHMELSESLSKVIRKCEVLKTDGDSETTRRKKELATTMIKMLADVNRASEQKGEGFPLQTPEQSTMTEGAQGKW